MQKSEYETGARKFPAKQHTDASDEFAPEAASNKPPHGIGNSEPVDEAEEKVRHSDGRGPAAASRPDPKAWMQE